MKRQAYLEKMIGFPVKTRTISKRKKILTVIKQCFKFFLLRNKLLEVFIDYRRDEKQFAQMFSMETQTD